jgi:hypothetical protein
VTFSLGAPDVPDAVTSLEVPLPAGKFSVLKMLALAVNGSQESQQFTANYSDGASSKILQSMSDWYEPRNFAGEADVANTPYRFSGSSRDNRTFHIYGYSLRLDDTRTLKSFTLPENRDVVVLGMVLVRDFSRGSSPAK